MQNNLARCYIEVTFWCARMVKKVVRRTKRLVPLLVAVRLALQLVWYQSWVQLTIMMTGVACNLNKNNWTWVTWYNNLQWKKQNSFTKRVFSTLMSFKNTIKWWSTGLFVFKIIPWLTYKTISKLRGCQTSLV